MPITACGLRPDDEAMRIAVALGSELGSPHSCRCGSSVDARGMHGLVCKHESAAGIPVKKEPTGLDHKDGKHLKAAPSFLGAMVNHWLGMSQSATVADSYLTAASHAAAAVAKQEVSKICRTDSILRVTTSSS